eukprot:6804510-Lingulodinium_polyedra.AAC.1
MLQAILASGPSGGLLPLIWASSLGLSFGLQFHRARVEAEGVVLCSGPQVAVPHPCQRSPGTPQVLACWLGLGENTASEMAREAHAA